MGRTCATCGHVEDHHKTWAGVGNAYCFADGCGCPEFSPFVFPEDPILGPYE